MRRFKQGAALAVATVAALAGALATSSPAMAASSPISACGGGSYHVIDQHDLGKATVYLLYNGTTNCVVTWKDSPNSTYVNAVMRVEGSTTWGQDPGNFSTYAGPVKISAKGQCIQWGGIYGSAYYTSPFEHCG
ncbi:spore-associated protein A [Streptosporangium sp. NBC_01756]|uniref:spore-associated protein A n=1 Tax=Streptosporangium sp. NBC_01756 TaxID=2975950 RepID=UPI002DDA007E|nr:spore-associated protein A [Streptosporangium sp. NBC_01756]WSC90467.1 spore-associated protein A [Streptosporangium sp. NBC_01756]